MRAIIYEKIKGKPSLSVQSREKPVPGPKEVLIQVHAVSINAADYRSMKMGIIPKNKILGQDIAGKIEICGSAVTKFKVGDLVFGDISGCGSGGFAEYVSVPEAVLSYILDGVSFIEAAALPMSSVTALQALRNKGSIEKGQSVLIYGSGGGVGTFAVQLAKAFEANVTALCGPRNIELMQKLGADKIIDYSTYNFRTSKIKYDLILGVNGKQKLSTYHRALNKNGRYVMVGGHMKQILGSLFFGWLYSFGNKKMRFLAAKPSAKDLDFIMKLVAKKEIVPIIDRLYPFEETSEAMMYAQSGHAKGKIVIEIKHNL